MARSETIVSRTTLRIAAQLILLLAVVTVDRADAQYIDPGSGSYILQLLIAGFLAFAVYSKKVKDYIKKLLSIVFSKK